MAPSRRTSRKSVIPLSHALHPTQLAERAHGRVELLQDRDQPLHPQLDELLALRELVHVLGHEAHRVQDIHDPPSRHEHVVCDVAELLGVAEDALSHLAELADER